MNWPIEKAHFIFRIFCQYKKQANRPERSWLDTLLLALEPWEGSHTDPLELNPS